MKWSMRVLSRLLFGNRSEPDPFSMTEEPIDPPPLLDDPQARAEQQELFAESHRHLDRVSRQLRMLELQRNVQQRRYRGNHG